MTKEWNITIACRNKLGLWNIPHKHINKNEEKETKTRKNNKILQTNLKYDSQTNWIRRLTRPMK